MSRKKKRKRPQRNGCDKHHILFYRSEWNKGCLMLLRRAFVYEIPMEIHRELHANVEPVPPLSAAEAEILWHQFKLIDHSMDIGEAYWWLMDNSPNPEFKAAISEQYEFMREAFA